MRPKTKIDAQRLTITLSGPARDWLMAEARRRSVSRTQVIEDLVAKAEAETTGPFAYINHAPLQPRKSRA